MPKLKNICLAASLTICAACSTKSEIRREPAPEYLPLPAAFLTPCIVQDVALNTTGDIVTSRNRYKEAFEKCAAKVDAIRKHDAAAQEAAERQAAE